VVPGTWLSILFFFLFVAPGATYELRSRRRRATYEESAFIEISRIVLASLIFSGLALAVLVVVRQIQPDWLPEPRRLLAQDGTDYFRRRYALVLRALGAWSAIACAVAWGTNALLEKKQGGATIKPESAWTQVLRRERPAGSLPYARVRLDNGVIYSGLVVKFSSDLEVEGREIVLAPPLASKTPSTPGGLKPLPPQYQRVVLRGDSIEVLSIEYRPGPPPQPAARQWWHR
jgi:hypothetical protein